MMNETILVQCSYLIDMVIWCKDVLSHYKSDDCAKWFQILDVNWRTGNQAQIYLPKLVLFPCSTSYVKGGRSQHSPPERAFGRLWPIEERGKQPRGGWVDWDKDSREASSGEKVLSHLKGEESSWEASRVRRDNPGLSKQLNPCPEASNPFMWFVNQMKLFHRPYELYRRF